VSQIGNKSYAVLYPSEAVSLDDRFPEAHMQSPNMQESPHAHTPESNFNPIEKVSQLNRAVDGWRETRWFLKPEKDEFAGYLFDSEVLREGSD
jgi:hypothetical protein